MYGQRKVTWKDKMEMYILYRNKKGLTMQEIADRKGINVSTVHRGIKEIVMSMVNSLG